MGYTVKGRQNTLHVQWGGACHGGSDVPLVPPCCPLFFSHHPTPVSFHWQQGSDNSYFGNWCFKAIKMNSKNLRPQHDLQKWKIFHYHSATTQNLTLFEAIKNHQSWWICSYLRLYNACINTYILMLLQKQE